MIGCAALIADGMYVGVPTVPDAPAPYRFAVTMIAILLPALKMCSVGCSGMLYVLNSPGTTADASAYQVELRWRESIVPRVTRHWVTSLMFLVAST